MNSVLGGTVVGSTENLGAGYYKLSYNGLVAYTTIPYAIECYKAGTFADMLASVCTNEGIAAGTSVAAAMTADLTTVLTGKTTLLYGYDCAEMKALAAEFKTALAGLSADTKVDVSACLEKLTEALAIANWHTADFAGVCTNCGAEGLKAPTVQVPAVDELVSDSHTEAEKEVIENVATEIKQNTALDEFVPTNLPENTTLSVLLTSMGVENGTAYKLTFEVAPKDFMGTTIQPSGTVTFRLPIPASVIKTHANVYHNGELMGTYEIEGDGNGKYVEVETASFSEFTVETVDAPVTSVEVDTLEELQSALAADNDLTIVITATIVIPEGQTVTIDLNGKTINTAWENEAAGKHYYAFTNYGKMTITGTGVINARGNFNYGELILESGTINAIDGNGGYGVRNYPGATMIMNGGLIATTYEDDHLVQEGGYDATTVGVDAGATFEMNGGELKNICDFTPALSNQGTAVINNGKASSIHSTLINEGTMTINGGTFTNNGLHNVTAHAVLNYSDATLTINGGTFNAKTNYNGFALDADGGVVTINGGTFNGSPTACDADCNIPHGKVGTNNAIYVKGADAVVTVNGGTFDYGVYYVEGALSIKGGTWTNTNKAVTDHVAEGFELGEDGKVVATKTYAAQIGDKKFESLQDAINAAGAGETIVLLADISLTEVLTIAADKDVVLDLAGFAITRTVSQTVSENTYLLINDGTLTITDSVGEGLIELTYTGEKVARSISTICNRGTLNIQGGTINNNPGANSISYAIDNNSTISNAVINITGGSVTGGAQAYCIRLYLNSTVYANELNMTGGSVQYVWAQNPNTYANKGSISMTGDAKAWYVYVSAVTGECNAQNIALNVEEGTCYYAPACGTLAEGYVLKLVDGVYKIVPVVYVAQIGEQKFETLAEALKAAQAGETIVLLADISLTEALTIAADKDIVLDLAGKILSYASAEAKASAVITNKGKLTVKDSVGGGKITTSALNPDQSTVMPHYANNTISNLGQLIIDSGKIENTTNGVACYAIDNYSGSTLTVNDGEIVSVYSDAIRLFATDAAAATVIINGGTVGSIWAQDSSDGRKDTNYVLTVNGGTVGAIYVEPTYGAEVAIKGGEIEKVVIYDPENGNKHDSLYGIVTGGTFGAAMDEKLVADGFELVENENGTFGIEEVTFVAPSISVDKGVIHVTDTGNVVEKVIVFYTGEGVNSTAWANCVAAGKKYPEVNGKNGYMVYTDLENLPTLTTAGEYVVYLYYYEDAAYKNIRVTTKVTDDSYKDADELFVDIDESNKVVIGVPSAVGDFNKVVVFYTGEAPANTAWATCVAAGKLHQDVNGSAGYKHHENPSVMPELTVNGTYVLFLYYTNADGALKNIRKVVTVTNAETDDPVEEAKPAIKLDANDKVVVENLAAADFSKVVVFYTNGDNANTSWDECVKAGKLHQDVNGTNGFKVYKNAENLPELTVAGEYVMYLYYLVDGIQQNVRVVVTVG